MSAKEKVFEIPRTISETIYQYLKKAIISGEFKPKQRVLEKEISRFFQVSSTPVREAFLRLAAEKYLVIDARRQVLVRETTLNAVKELYEVVRALDGLAASKAVKRLTDQEIAVLKKMTQKLGEYYEKKKIQSYLEQNLKIHDQIWKSCGNKFLYETLNQLMEKIAIYRRHSGFQPFAVPSAIEKSYSDHLRIMDAIEKKDLARLKKIIIVHWGEEFFIEKNQDL